MEKHFMDGSASKHSYLIFGVRGKAALGIRLVPPLNAGDVGSVQPGTVLPFRIRSAATPAHLVPTTLTEDGVTSIADIPSFADYAQAWPHLTFEKLDHTRASFSSILYTKLRLQHANEVQQMHDTFSEALASGLADFLIASVEKDGGKLLYTKEELVGHISEFYKAPIAAYLAGMSTTAPIALEEGKVVSIDILEKQKSLMKTVAAAQFQPQDISDIENDNEDGADNEDAEDHDPIEG